MSDTTVIIILGIATIAGVILNINYRQLLLQSVTFVSNGLKSLDYRIVTNCPFPA